MSVGSTYAIDFFRRRLRVVEATVRRGTVHVVRAVSLTIPDDIPNDNEEAIGHWIRDSLLRRGMEVSRATVAINREHTVVRRITLPTRESDEFADMVGLAMKRDLPIDPESAVIDFIVLGHDDTNTEVIACAAPISIIDRVRAIALAAGITPTRISLRCFGTAVLVKGLVASRGRPVLAIDLGADGFEFVVSQDGRIGFTRGVETRPGANGVDESIVTEVRRSWISHRLSEREDEEVKSGVLFGSFELTERLEGWIGEATGLEMTTIHEHPRVQIPSDFPGDTWPLAGLLLREAQRVQTINFLAPKKAPDVAARRRQRILLACGVILICALIGWTFGNLQLSREVSRNEELEGKARTALNEYYRNRRDRLRVEHLDAWVSVQPDWIAHFTAVQSFAPDPTRVVFDKLTAELLVGSVEYGKDNVFSTQGQVRFNIDGEARDRLTADALRSSLVEEEGYLLRSTGSETSGGRRFDVPFGFQVIAPIDPPLGGVSGDEESTP